LHHQGKFDGFLDSDDIANDLLDFDGTEDGMKDGFFGSDGIGEGKLNSPCNMCSINSNLLY
jgi:hypothetical protein